MRLSTHYACCGKSVQGDHDHDCQGYSTETCPAPRDKDVSIDATSERP